MPKIKRANADGKSFAKNFILSALPGEEAARLEPLAQTVNLTLQQPLYQTGKPIEYIYFPTTAVLSWIATTNEGERVEVGVVGWEGVVGVAELLDYQIAPYEVEAELPGEAIRIKVEHLRREFARLPALQNLVFHYNHTVLTQLAQSSVCNRFHTVEERMLRWLLMAHDRCDGDELGLTQEILAGMIGARRPAVSIVAGNLQKSGFLRAERGRVTILDREKMEAAACECYRVIREAFEQFIRRSGK